MSLERQARSALTRAGAEVLAAATLVRAGAVGVDRPSRIIRSLQGLLNYGPAGAALVLAAQRHPDRVAIVDERGPLTFAELDRHCSALANALISKGFRSGDTIGVLCRNHRGIVEVLGATAKLGARVLLLNTDFSGPQLADVCERESVALLIADEEFRAVLATTQPRLGHVLAWVDEPTGGRALPPGRIDSVDGLIATSSSAPPDRPQRKQQIVLLTSGTTGTPKGAPRELGSSLVIPGGLLSRIPLRAARTVLIAAPVFHAWGLLSTMIAASLGNTLILRRRFDPAQALDDLAEHRCDTLVTVPILLSRILAQRSALVGEGDLSALRIIAVSGSALSPELARRTREVFGDVLYNLYGSTEVAYAAIATPADLRAAPGCVGKAPIGTTIRLLDEHGRSVARGQTGRIFVGNLIQFGGYTGGGTKEQQSGLMATGDVGHFDEDGRLFVDGRDDDMIVSGGENVFPAEIEDLLTAHPGLAEAAVLGVPDPDFGHRLRAYVVRADRASSSPDAEAVQDYVRQNLARFKVPRDVIFIEAMPRNPAGKIVKRELPEP
ncbi:acyl-CoA synthetase [Jatrophihabitans telluris]|uniref:Acyl-CoA synthetase n=1 Tax=Jatrophihabitans telluris TaxID=2038343 RepID=A0ABY4QWA2_9ACTN|nr:acyl-CoA synthetase [Jatrophihabitans telluris]UQX87321.1 acyl-CoA synthetase [Jatrophihabitans telluris]